ncbi:MAG TPA: antitoxin [Caulobacteraceae bacterium]|jgi:predicted transcriptional regulator
MTDPRDPRPGFEEEASIFDDLDDEALELAMQEAEADIAAGRVVPHEEVAKWLRTWGTPSETPPPPEWFK